MTSPPGTPVVTPAQLGTYLGRTDLDDARAAMLIRYAQDLCEAVLFPLPLLAYGIVMRVAARGITNVTSAQSMSLGSAQISYGSNAYGVGGIYLSKLDKADLRRLAVGNSAAFTIETMPATAGQQLPWWDVDTEGFDVIP
jgi:hypothetical protein